MNLDFFLSHEATQVDEALGALLGASPSVQKLASYTGTETLALLDGVTVKFTTVADLLSQLPGTIAFTGKVNTAQITFSPSAYTPDAAIEEATAITDLAAHLKGIDTMLSTIEPAIGESITGATAGSVLFVGTGGILQQDNAAFFFDATSDRLGLGLTSPQETLHSAGVIATDSTIKIGRADDEFVILKNNEGELQLRNRYDNANADLVVENITITGTLTSIDSNVINLGDEYIVLNNDFTTGTPTANAGIEVRRGDETNASFLWDELNTLWKVGLKGSETEIIAKDTLGNVMLGSGTADTQLHVNGRVSIGVPGLTTTGLANFRGGDNAVILESFNSDQSDAQQFYVKHDTTTSRVGSTGALEFYANDAFAASLNTSGFLGLNTTNASHPLAVWGTHATVFEAARFHNSHSTGPVSLVLTGHADENTRARIDARTNDGADGYFEVWTHNGTALTRGLRVDETQHVIATGPITNRGYYIEARTGDYAKFAQSAAATYDAYAYNLSNLGAGLRLYAGSTDTTDAYVAVQVNQAEQLRVDATRLLLTKNGTATVGTQHDSHALDFQISSWNETGNAESENRMRLVGTAMTGEGVFYRLSLFNDADTELLYIDQDGNATLAKNLTVNGTTLDVGDGGTNATMRFDATANGFIKLNGATEITISPTLVTFAEDVAVTGTLDVTGITTVDQLNATDIDVTGTLQVNGVNSVLESRSLTINGTANEVTVDTPAQTLEANRIWTIGLPASVTLATSISAPSGTFTTADIDGGSIDGATVGLTTRSSGAFTTLAANGMATFTGGVTIGAISLQEYIEDVSFGGLTAGAGVDIVYNDTAGTSTISHTDTSAIANIGALTGGTVIDAVTFDTYGHALTLSTRVLTTTDIAEGTNLYWTDARWQTAWALKSTTNLPEGTNLYFTDERVDDRVNALLIGGANMTLTYDDGAGSLTLDVTGLTSAEISDFNEAVDDRAAVLIQPAANSAITWVYSDASGTLTPTITLAPYSTSDLSEGTNLYWTDTRWQTAWGLKTTTNLPEGSNLYFTDERVDDRAAALIQNGTGISWAYDDGAGTLTPTVSLTPYSTTNLAEGTNLYYTTARWDTKMAAASTSDLAEGTNLYFTDERVDDRVAALLVEGDNITFTYNDVGGTFTVDVTGLLAVDVGDFSEAVDDQVAVLMQDSANGAISWVYTDGAGTLVPTITLSPYSTSDLSEGTNLYWTDARWQTAWGLKSTTNLPEGTNLYFTDERVDDRVSALVQPAANSAITWAYDDGLGTFTPTITLSPYSTSDLSEGTNLYYTTARWDTKMAAATTSDLAEGVNLYFTAERVDDRVDALIQAGTGISWVYDDGLGTLTPTVSLAPYSTSDLTEGSNLYWTDARWQTAWGLKTTTNLPEGTQLYFTDERVDDRVAVLVQPSANSAITWVYTDAAGTLVPTITLSPYSTSDLSEGTNLYYTTARWDAKMAAATTADLAEGANLYYTDERVDDRVSALVQNGTGISWAYNDTNGTFTPTISLAPFSTSNLSEGSNLYYTTARWDTRLATKTTDNLAEGSNLYFTDERVDDRTAALIQNGTGLSWSYDDGLGTLTGTVSLGPYSTSDLSEGSNLYWTDARWQTAWGLKSTTNLPEGTQLYYTDERVDDRVSALVQNGTGISFAYNDTAGTLTPTVTLAPFSTSNLVEGSNLYYTTARWDTRLATKTTADLTEGANLYFTDERVDDRVSSLIQAGTGISWVYSDGAGTLTPTVSLSPYSTSDLSEGTSLYYTDARVDARITGTWRAAVNGLASLGADGKIPVAQLPALAITDTFTVADQTAMLALTAQTGDIAVRTDELKTYILSGSDPSVLGDWTELATPTDVVLSVNGYTGTVVIDTDDIAEGTNLYFTDERVDDRLSTTIQNGTGISWSYSDVGNTFTPTITLAPFSTTNLTEGTNLYYTTARWDSKFAAATTSGLAEGSNLYFTDERVDDRVAALVQDGTGISWVYSDVSGTLTPTISLAPFTTSNLAEGSNLYYTSARWDSKFAAASTSGLAEGSNLYYTDARWQTAWGLKTTTNLPEGTNQYYTDERVDDRVAVLVTNGTGLTWTYNDTNGTLTGVVSLSPYSTSDLTEGTNLYYTQARFDSAFTAKSTTDLSEGTNLYFTDERVDDRVSVLVQNGTGISFAYNDVGGTFTPTVTLAPFSTTNLSEGSNLYYTQARFDAAFTAKSTTDLSEGSNLYHTDERVDDRVAVLVQNGTGLTWTYNDTLGTLTGVVSLAPYSTNDLAEGSNLYYTQGRFDGAFTAKSTTDLSEGSNLYFTDERVDDRVSVLVQNGTGISFSYDDVGGTFTPTVTLSPFDTGNLSEGANLYYTQARFDSAFTNKSTTNLSEGSNLYYTDARVDARLGTAQSIGAAWTFTSNLRAGFGLALEHEAGELAGEAGYTTLWANAGDSLKYRDGTGVSRQIAARSWVDAHTWTTSDITDWASAWDVRLATKDTGDLTEGANLYYTTARANSDFDTRLATKSTSDVAEGTNLYFTNERVDDRIDVLVQDAADAALTWVYNDTLGTLTPTVVLTPFDTGDLSEGVNLYYTQARFDSAFTAKSTSDLSEGSNLYHTDERVDDRVATLIQNGTGLTWTYVDGSNTLTGNVSLAPFDTGDLTEGGNLYYTQARFDAAFTAKSTSDLSEGTNLYYTDARVDSRLDTVQSIAANWTWQDAVLTVAHATTSAQIILNAAAGQEAQFTFKQGGLSKWQLLTDGGGDFALYNYDLAAFSLTINDADGTVNLVQGALQTAGTTRLTSAGVLQNVTADTAIITSGTFADARISQSSVTQHQAALTVASTQVSDWAEAVDDRVGALLVAGNSVTIDYNDVANTITISAAADLQAADNETISGLWSFDGEGIRLQNETVTPTGTVGYTTFHAEAGGLFLRNGTGTLYRVLSTADEGAGNGLDADLLDGLQATAFSLTGHTHALGDATDVLDTTNTDGFVLTWVNANSRWEPAAVAANLADLGDTTIGSLTTNEFLKWSGAAWVNAVVDWSHIASIPATFAPSAHTHTASEVTDWAEAVDDRVSALFVAGSMITLTYSDVGNTFTVAHDNTSSVADSSNSGATVIQSLTFDGNGHVQTLATKTLAYGDIGAAGASHTHNASDINAGTLADARLSSNVALKDTAAAISGVYTFSAAPKFDETLQLQNESGSPTGVVGYSTLWAEAGGLLKFRDGTGTIYTTTTDAHTHTTAQITNLSSWSGSTSLVTLGNVATGTWQADPITSAYIGSHAHTMADITAGGVYAFAAGAVGTPSMTATGDLDSGIFFPGADQLSIATAGVERVAVNATGDIYTADGTAELATTATTGFFWIATMNGTPTGTPANLRTGQAPMVIDRSSGTVYAYYDDAWNPVGGGGNTPAAYGSTAYNAGGYVS